MTENEKQAEKQGHTPTPSERELGRLFVEMLQALGHPLSSNSGLRVTMIDGKPAMLLPEIAILTTENAALREAGESVSKEITLYLRLGHGAIDPLGRSVEASLKNAIERLSLALAGGKA